MLRLLFVCMFVCLHVWIHFLLALRGVVTEIRTVAGIRRRNMSDSVTANKTNETANNNYDDNYDNRHNNDAEQVSPLPIASASASASIVQASQLLSTEQVGDSNSNAIIMNATALEADATTAATNIVPRKQWNVNVNKNNSAASPRLDLRNIMQEQQQEQQQQQQLERKQRHEASLRVQEDEMLRRALEQSLLTASNHNSLSYLGNSLSEQEQLNIHQALQESSEEQDDSKQPAKPTTINVDVDVNWQAAAEHLSEQELQQIHQALQESSLAHQQTNQSTTTTTTTTTIISDEERAAIERAIAEADAQAEAASYQLALKLVQEEMAPTATIVASTQQHQQHQQQQGHIRVMTRAQVLAMETSATVPGAFYQTAAHLLAHPDDQNHHDDDDDATPAGFRLNAATPHAWTRRDAHTVIGPDGGTARTKHDAALHAAANAHRLALQPDEAVVGNTAYNSFHQSLKQRGRTKGVAAHGTGRAGSDAAGSGTKGGAMDAAVRAICQKAVNAGWIGRMHGAVKEGKEALIYYATEGEETRGNDVAVKVFKRIQEFKGRGSYVDGDPRYAAASFNKASAREQLALWTEKEYRNLVRANRAGVPVATPLHYKDNVLLMRFLGQDGWPCPQLREVDLRKGSARWTTFYTQVLESMRLLYQKARLVHGDLSEYNILAVPAFLVENQMVIDVTTEIQAVLIDFGQAVDVQHPEAEALLRRDLDRVHAYFTRQGVTTAMSVKQAYHFCVLPDQTERQEEEIGEEKETNEHNGDVARQETKQEGSV